MYYAWFSPIEVIADVIREGIARPAVGVVRCLPIRIAGKEHNDFGARLERYTGFERSVGQRVERNGLQPSMALGVAIPAIQANRPRNIRNGI